MQEINCEQNSYVYVAVHELSVPKRKMVVFITDIHEGESDFNELCIVDQYLISSNTCKKYHCLSLLFQHKNTEFHILHN